MRVEMHQGINREHVEWLWDYVGPGNITPAEVHLHSCDLEQCLWYAERIEIGEWYVPTVVIKDDVKATMFALRWA